MTTRSALLCIENLVRSVDGESAWRRWVHLLIAFFSLKARWAKHRTRVMEFLGRLARLFFVSGSRVARDNVRFFARDGIQLSALIVCLLFEYDISQTTTLRFQHY
jgi:hypothetical protein